MPSVSLQELELAGWVSGHADLPLRQVGDLGLAWGDLLTQDSRVSWWAGSVGSTGMDRGSQWCVLPVRVSLGGHSTLDGTWDLLPPLPGFTDGMSVDSSHHLTPGLRDEPAFGPTDQDVSWAVLHHLLMDVCHGSVRYWHSLPSSALSSGWSLLPGETKATG